MNLKLIAAALVSAFSTLTWGADFTPNRQFVKPIIAFYQPESAQTVDKVTGKVTPVQAGFSGSAVVIAPGYMLTAAHVVSHSGLDLFIRGEGSDIRSVKPIKVDKELDLALLKVAIDCPCIQIATNMPPIDDPVVSIGFPYYLIYNVQLASEGRVQGYRGFQVVSTATTAPGGSGGGLFSKEDGVWKMSGVVTAIASSRIDGLPVDARQIHTWMAFSTGPKAIRAFLVGTPAALK